jgi:membrane protease YdiL (CAAX protease family)
VVTAEVQNNRAAIHGCLFFAILVIVNAGFPSLLWPWYLFLPLLVYGGTVLTVAPLRLTASKLAIGKMSGLPLVSAAVLTLMTTSVLVGFQALMRPDVHDLAAKLQVDRFGNLLLAGVCFSVVNAALEELIFRGVLWNLVSEEWNQSTALCVTAALFGIGHFNGYPPGPIGAVMAGLYGATLGALRWWTGGLGLAMTCHVGADATIFSILATTGAFDSQ